MMGGKTGIDLIDRFLPKDDEGTPKKKLVSLLRIMDGDVEWPGKSGEVILDDGTQIATVHTDLDPKVFSAKLRLVIPAEQYQNLEVMCDGNALEITTEQLPDGRYIMRRKLRGYVPSIMEDEGTIELPEFDTTKDFLEWVEKQSTDMVEALRQIYYDRWNFDTGNQRDRMYYELLDEEKKGRQ